MLFRDDTGLLFRALPPGEHVLNMVHVGRFPDHSHWLEPPLTFTVARPGEVYYLGDVIIDWAGAGTAASLGAAVGSIALAGLPGYVGIQYLMRGDLTVGVESKQSEAEAAFRQKYGTERALVAALLAPKK